MAEHVLAMLAFHESCVHSLDYGINILQMWKEEWVDIAFDFHGYSRWDKLLAHARRKNGHRMPGWNCALVELPPDVLVSEAKSKTYDGLWLRGPEQYLHDALPRARAYLDRFRPPVSLDGDRSANSATA